MKGVIGYIILIIGAVLVLPTLINAMGQQKRLNMAQSAALLPATVSAQSYLSDLNYQHETALQNQQIQANLAAQNSNQNYNLISQGIGAGTDLVSQWLGNDSNDSES
ncbi:MAG TPA: hypothetical protein VMU24_02315 [Candidatus Acidoferrales bacterium]|nr:hypothetical protein [Candidatus Acidoferrales bacterium]